MCESIIIIVYVNSDFAHALSLTRNTHDLNFPCLHTFHLCLWNDTFLKFAARLSDNVCSPFPSNIEIQSHCVNWNMKIYFMLYIFIYQNNNVQRFDCYSNFAIKYLPIISCKLESDCSSYLVKISNLSNYDFLLYFLFTCYGE